MTAPDAAMRERAERVADRSWHSRESVTWEIIYEAALAALREQAAESAQHALEMRRQDSICAYPAAGHGICVPDDSGSQCERCGFPAG